VNRTVPATERRELVKAVGSSFRAAGETTLADEVVESVEKILGKEIQGYNRLLVDAKGKVTLFAARNPGGHAYSEFHFGAGEASVIRIVSEIEDAEENSLILVEEIENGLHPVATRRMVEYLIDVARRKASQVIFTTHSNDALGPLPPRAIWAAYNGEVLQGKLDIKALRTITGQIEAKLAIFVEDEFGELLVTSALRQRGGIEMDAIKIHAMGGATPSIKVNEQHNLDPTAKFPSVCLLDGDQADLADPTNGVGLLPGSTSPEMHIFNRVFERLDALAARLTVSMQLPSARQDDVKKVVRERQLTNRDPHVLFQQIGDDLDFTAGYIVANAFLAVWAQEYPEDVDRMLGQFEALIPTR